MENTTTQNPAYAKKRSYKSIFSAFVISLALFQNAFAGSLYSETQAESLRPAGQKIQRKYVNSYEDYKDHNRSHVERVRRLATAGVHAHPELFPGVNLNLLDEFASWHDMEKFLDKYSRRLYEAYGKKFKTNTGQAVPGLEEHFKMTDELNATGDKIERQFFSKYNTGHRFIGPDGKYTPLAKLYQIAVKAADRGDRAMSEVSPEEFNKPMESVSAYAKKNPGLISDIEVKLAAYYEAPVSEIERMAYLRKLVTPSQSLEELMRKYKTVRKYDVLTQGSSLKEYQFRRRRNAALMCIMNSISKNSWMDLN